MEYKNSQMQELIREYIHSERDREILSRRLIDHETYQDLAEDFDLSVRHVGNIVRSGKRILFSQPILSCQ